MKTCIFLLSLVLSTVFSLPNSQLAPFAYANPDVEAYYPLGYNLLGNTQYVSGWNNLSADDGNYAIYRSYLSQTTARTLYTHQEPTIIAGLVFYSLKIDSADATGMSFSAAVDSLGRKLWGKLVYSLQGISSIEASTWTIYYRAYTEGGAVRANVDILVRRADGPLRNIIATNVAVSPNLGTSWSTVSGTYSWASYAVVNQTDYLEIDFYVEVATASIGRKAYLRLDDNSLAASDQTRAVNIVAPSEFAMEVEFTGSSNIHFWAQVIWAVDSAWTAVNVTVTLQLYNFTMGDFSISENGYVSYISSSTPNSDETKNQTITTNPAHFRDGIGRWKMKVKGVKSTSLQFDFKIDLAKFEVTYIPDYIPPAWSNAGTNETDFGKAALFSVKWTDSFGLSGFIFGTNNTGTWQNDTWTPMSGLSNWSNVTKTLNNAVDAVVQWQVWANDTSNNWNTTGILSFIITDIYTHDIAISGVSTSVNEIFAGQTMNIWVWLTNEGTANESSVTATVYFNGLGLIPQTIADFANGTEKLLAFVWEVRGIAHGNYTVRASVNSVPRETDTIDNSLTYGVVEVRITGDINEDGKVDYKDAFLLLKSYGKVEGDPKYNRNADFNYDGKVDYKDVFLFLKMYGYVERFVIEHQVRWGPKTYRVVTESNSTVSSLAFSQANKEISFNVTGPTGGKAYCKVQIPIELLRGPFTVLIDGVSTRVTYGGNETYTFITFYYDFDSGTRRVQIIGAATVSLEQETQNILAPMSAGAVSTRRRVQERFR